MGGKLTRLSCLVFWILLAPFSAIANDTAASIGVGGLVLEKNNHIEMVSEVLEISTQNVRVTYHFMNTANKDIKTTVAFPMPAFYESDENNVMPLDSFRMSVNGKDVAVQKHRRFLIGDVDVTARLRKIGLTDEQIFDPSFACWDPFPGDVFHGFPCRRTKRQIAAIVDLQKRMKGNWSIQETAYWDQTFPAHKDMEVTHEYKPFAGFNDHNSNPDRDGCIDKGTQRALNKQFAESGGVNHLLQEVKYILGTGRNWRGPIKHFKLIIDKDDPTQVVSLCFPGKAVKTSPTTIQFTQSNYVPQDKLDIFFFNY